MTEEISKIWRRLGDYIWWELEKEWPYFWTDDITGLDWYVEERCNIKVGPDKLSRPDPIDIINQYLDYHTLCVNLLTNKYKEMEESIEMFSDLGRPIVIDWCIGLGIISFYIQEGTHFKKGFKNYLEVLQKHLGYSSKKADLMACFSGTDIPEEVLNETRFIIEEKYDKFVEKWEPILDKEAEIANNLLQDIVNNRIFNEKGKLAIENICKAVV